MPFLCKETNKEFLNKRRDYVLMHPVIKVGYAVCGEIVDEIIASRDTYADRWRRYNEGINIHRIESSLGESEVAGYLRVFAPGSFVVAITNEVAEKYFPNTLQAIQKAAERRTPN